MPILDGIRVLDFGRFVAGPYCACLLGDFGAEVIRVERVDGAEDREILPIAEDGTGAYFLQVNRNKLGMTVDPSQPAGREVIRRLVATADVVVANLPPRTLERMGLDYASLCRARPDVILTTASAFGSGPWAEKLGFDGIGQAMSGAMHLSGGPDEPMKLANPYVDFTTAILSAFGTVLALLERARTGRGQHVEASLLASALTVTNGYLIEQAVIGSDRVGSGNRSQLSAPSDVFRTRDGWILVQTVGRPHFERWARLVGADEWLADPAFATDADRAAQGGRISARMRAWCAGRTTEVALAELEEAGVGAAPVLSPRQVLEDPHVAAAGLLAKLAFPGVAQAAPIAATPVRLSATPGSVRRRAPRLGEHTGEILEALGYTAAERAELRAKGAV